MPMDFLSQQIGRVRRHLQLELFFNRLLFCWLLGLVAALTAITVPKLVAIPQIPPQWATFCISMGVGSGLLAAFLWTFWNGPSELDAAQEIDRRYELKERVASLLSLSPEEFQTPAGQALLADTHRAVRGKELSERFKLKVTRQYWLPLLGTCLLLFTTGFVENRSPHNPADNQSVSLSQQRVSQIAEQLNQQLTKQQQEAELHGLLETRDLVRELKNESARLASMDESTQKRVLIKLNDLAETLKQQQQQTSNDEELREQFAKMEEASRGPAQSFFDSLKQGNWQDAQQALDKLNQQIADKALSSQQTQQLQEQLNQVRKEVTEFAETNQRALDQLQTQLEHFRNQGDSLEAGKAQQQVEDLQRQRETLGQLESLAQQSDLLQESLQTGDNAKATQSLDEMKKKVQEFQQDSQKRRVMDSALQQIEMAKDMVGCPTCQGGGCPSCQQSLASTSKHSGNQSGIGNSPGGRSGQFHNDLSQFEMRDTRVRQAPKEGAAVAVGTADGPNVTGETATEFREAINSASSAPADPQTLERLPQSRREHAAQYFNLIREDN